MVPISNDACDNVTNYTGRVLSTGSSMKEALGDWPSATTPSHEERMSCCFLCAWISTRNHILSCLYLEKKIFQAFPARGRYNIPWNKQMIWSNYLTKPEKQSCSYCSGLRFAQQPQAVVRDFRPHIMYACSLFLSRPSKACKCAWAILCGLFKQLYPIILVSHLMMIKHCGSKGTAGFLRRAVSLVFSSLLSLLCALRFWCLFVALWLLKERKKQNQTLIILPLYTGIGHQGPKGPFSTILPYMPIKLLIS